VKGCEEGDAVSMEPLSGDDPAHIAGYQIRARLGAGGMGRVYLAYTPGGRPVALKIVRPEFDDDPSFRERFRHEVDAARRVHGIYTAQVLDADPSATPPWLVTAYVPGPSLQQAVGQHGPMPPDTVFELMAGVAEALAAIHAVGVVHRDLKPSNVILAPDGPRVIDFGIARAADASAITRQGIRVGSPQFMAPEQILARPPAPAVDVFALGHLAAYAVLGRSPFGDGDAQAVFARILNQPPDLGSCPQPLRALIERCLSKDPDARPAPAGVVAACRGHQNPQTVQIAGTWLPPAMAAAVAQHAAPPAPLQNAAQPAAFAQPAPTMPAPPPTYPYTTGATPQPSTGVYIPRTTLVRSGVAVVVIGALVALGVVVLHGSNSTGPSTPPHSSSPAAASNSQPLAAGSASQGPSSGLDSCVIGTWKGVSQVVTNNINGEPAEFTGPGPVSITLRPDGTGQTDWGAETLGATVNGEAWTEVVDGSATYDYQTSNGSVLFSDGQVSGTETLYVDGIKNTSAPLSPLTSGQYTCSGNTLKFFAPNGTGSTELTRTS
jgi:serine/threonine protein kinase